MLSIINSSNLIGIESFLIKVEVDITNGLPCFNIVGLVGTEIKEARERVKSALINSNFKFPNSRIVVNLSPADMKKEGSYFDLPISIGILRQSIKKDDNYLSESMFIGELSLDGNLRKVRGILPIIIGAKNNGLKRIFIPKENLVEASFIDDIDIIPVESLSQCIGFLNDSLEINHKEIVQNIKRSNYNEEIYRYEDDFSDVAGNYFVKRSAEIAAAGNHNLLMIGPPGSGKTMIAKRLGSILPQLQKEEMIEVSKIYSAAGLMNENVGIVAKRPFRSPHHTVTRQALTGGGHEARPGEIVLAHKGVLFLDEICEFDKRILDTLRQPLEDKCISISRVKYNFEYPCNVMLIGATNPCPCGYYMSDSECKCRSFEVDRYLNKISGPLLDRFDMFVEVSYIPNKDFDYSNCESSSDIRTRVEKARKIQVERFKNEGISTNDEMKSSHLNKYCKLEDSAHSTLDLIFNKYKLSNRSYTKLIKVSRTIADLENKEYINSSHIMEAFSYRKAYYTYFK